MVRWLAAVGLMLCAFDAWAQPVSVIQRRCAGCHNAQVKAGNLTFADRPGNPERLLERVTKGEMPPAGKLPDSEIAEFAAWVKAGAPWDAAAVGKAERKRAGRDWWSLQPLKQFESGAGVSIDGFVRAKLAASGLAMNGEADRRTLIRRVTFDLTGLPPSPEEIDAFLADRDPQAYEKVVDRLLASPRYGERWARHWFDVARFGESHGYEQNHLRDRAWPYRDWAIRAFNLDMSFREMVAQQLAGDQFGAGKMEVESATGFLVAGPHDTVGIQNVDGMRLQRANDLDDVVTATAAGFLGLTVGCARCHDHKFDPILQRDYYQLAAVFDGLQHAEREVATAGERAARDAVVEPLRAEMKSVDEKLAELKASAAGEVAARKPELTHGYRPAVDSKLTAETFAPVKARFVRLTIRAANRRSTPSLDEFEVFSGGANVALGAKANARKTRSTMDDSRAFYQPELLTDGKFDAQWISGDDRSGQVSVELAEVHVVDKVQWSRDRLGAFQNVFLGGIPVEYDVEVSLDGGAWTRVAGSEGRLPHGDREMDEFLLVKVRPEAAALLERKTELQAKLSAAPKLATVYAGKFEQPKEPLKLNKGGNPMNLGDEMRPASPSTLADLLPGFALDPTAPEAERRLALARWLTDDRNALVARVAANRVWFYHFGRGIVGTPSDFGYNGERPTHPELLDYLAGRLIANGWRWKPLHREIVLSAAYRQSPADNAKARGADAESRLLWRYPPRRLDGEALRDATLAVSGKLQLEPMGGPGFRLYRYTVDNVATYYPLDNPGPETYRRAVYHQWARSVKDDFLSVYDCPDSSLPEPRRAQTTTPLQALSSMNSAFGMDQARFFAERVGTEGDAGSQVARAYRLAFGRPASAAEIEEGVRFLAAQPLAMFCRVLLNSNEFAYVF